MAIFEVNPTELIIKTAEKLKENEHIKPPEWAKFVRTGHGKERPPVQEDWWHVRAASILRKLMIKGPIGVNKLKVAFGCRKNMGFAPERSTKAGGNIIRKLLQQLEKAGLAKKAEKDVYKGRIATSQGISLLDKTAAQILKDNPPEKIQMQEIKVPERIIPKKEQPKKKIEYRRDFRRDRRGSDRDTRRKPVQRKGGRKKK